MYVCKYVLSTSAVSLLESFVPLRCPPTNDARPLRERERETERERGSEKVSE